MSSIIKARPGHGVKVYVAGPYTKGDTIVNIRTAIRAGTRLMEMGFIPFVPHLSGLWQIVTPQDYDTWLDYDMHWLAECNAVLRLPGDSVGADREVDFAIAHNIPVFYSITELNDSISVAYFDESMQDFIDDAFGPETLKIRGQGGVRDSAKDPGCAKVQKVSSVDSLTPATLNARDVVKYLGLSRSTVYKLTSSGRLPKPMKIGRCVRWRRQDLDDWVADGGTSGGATGGRLIQSDSPIDVITGV